MTRMDVDDENSSVEQQATLNEFLKDWKEDLVHKHSTETNSVASHLGKRLRDDSSDDQVINDEDHDKVHRPCEPERFETLPLFVLPSPEKLILDKKVSSINIDKQPPQGLSQNAGSLVDTLISDLDEVNSIPFFEVQLPKEVAVIVFSHLNMRDLCSCSMVSRSWNVLAEDNVLWFNLYQQMKLNVNKGVGENVQWKVVVKEIIQLRKQVLQNWKERKCGIQEYQPDNAGVLAAACYSEGSLMSCYTSGEAIVWRIDDHVEPFSIKYLSTQRQFQPTCCAVTDRWGVVGTRNGEIHIIDVDSCSEKECLLEAGTVTSLAIAHGDDKVVVAAVTVQTRFDGSTGGNITIFSARNGDSSSERYKPVRDLPIKQMKLVSPHNNKSVNGVSLLYSTSTSLTFHPLHSTPIPILSSTGQRGSNYVSCFDCDATNVACGTSTFGYKVQVYELQSGAIRSTLRGHNQHVTCVNIFQSSPEFLVSGSSDKRVRVFDCRSGSLPVITLVGHSAPIHCAQMDEWKVVSGSSDGCIIVWDQRMMAELWRSHERHPVEFCNFDQNHLVTCYIPVEKNPVIDTGNPFICHRRHRGLIRLYDFSVDTFKYRTVLPSICSSTFDEPTASFYNLDLKYPYDSIT